MFHNAKEKLLNQHIGLIVSEPWDFGTEIGVGPLSGQIIKVSINSDKNIINVLLKLDISFRYKNTECEYFVAQPGNLNEPINNILKGSKVECSLYQISTDRVFSDNWSDLSRWRGGVALLSTLFMVKK